MEKPGNEEEPRSEFIAFRATREERDVLMAFAEVREMTLSELIREYLWAAVDVALDILEGTPQYDLLAGRTNDAAPGNGHSRVSVEEWTQ